LQEIPIYGLDLVLRELNDDDYSAVLRIINAQQNRRVSDPDDAARIEIERVVSVFMAWAKVSNQVDPDTGKRENYNLAVIDISDPERLIGSVAIQTSGQVRQLAYFIDPDKQGQGYATRASFLLLECFFASTPYEGLIAMVNPGNRASMRVLEKLGFEELGANPYILGGEIEPHIVFGLLREDFYAATESFRRMRADENIYERRTPKAVWDNV
jgi:RimJ/RimL family protein N-acetyltransferase